MKTGTEEKPKSIFEEIITVTKKNSEISATFWTFNLPDVGLSFNSERIGPLNFNDLRNADYGFGFRMPTLQELVKLVYASFEHHDYMTSRIVKKALKKNCLAGNTGILYTEEGMYVQDNPRLIDKRISMDQKDLDKSLAYVKNRVFFSNDETVRFTRYGFKIESQTSLELSKNRGVIALVGNEENAEKIAKISRNFRVDPYFCALDNVDLPRVRVAGLASDGPCGRLDVDAYYDGLNFNTRCSFGVFGESKGVILEKLL